MRAAVLERQGEPIRIYDDVDIIEPRTNEVRVNVKYCGLCHSDYSVLDNAMGPIAGPMILGHEAAGIVESVGPGVTHLAPGDHVVLTPTPPCGQCYYCLRGDHSLCVNSISMMISALPDGNTSLSRGGETILRGLGVGALAEYVVTPATGAIKIDDDVPLELACVIGCAMQTGVGAVLNTADVEAGATVMMLGLGGIGMAAVQGARIAGAATIIVSDPIAERRELARKFGATHTLDPANDDIVAKVMELTNGIGVDYAFETAGKAALIEVCIQAIRSGGTAVAVGAPPLEESVTLNNAVIFAATQKKLCGCLLGSSNSPYEIPRLVRLWQNGRLDLESMITARRPLAEVNEGFADLAAGKGIRTVLTI